VHQLGQPHLLLLLLLLFQIQHCWHDLQVSNPVRQALASISQLVSSNNNPTCSWHFA
jgi:hypothetical protein